MWLEFSANSVELFPYILHDIVLASMKNIQLWQLFCVNVCIFLLLFYAWVPEVVVYAVFANHSCWRISSSMFWWFTCNRNCMVWYSYVTVIFYVLHLVTTGSLISSYSTLSGTVPLISSYSILSSTVTPTCPGLISSEWCVNSFLFLSQCASWEHSVYLQYGF